LVIAGAVPLRAQESPISSGAKLGTAVVIDKALTGLLDKGGMPTSLQQLQRLEKQHQKVAAAAAGCTVSVQIGAAQGCGVIITPDGYVLTAAHVAMRPGKRAMITLSDGRTVKATTLGMNRGVDAGLIMIDEQQNGNRPWPHATLGSSANLVPGMWCVATGHPGGYEDERGPVTRVGRLLAVRPDALVTDCALIGGDSGGPLFDLAGRLIAVHSRIGNDVQENLHVPIDHYDFAWDRLAQGKAWGFLPGFRPVLGVTGNQTTEKATILDVKDGSPAQKAGLKVDDVVEQFGEVSIADFDSLKRAVADTMPGERVVVWVKRGNKRIRFSVEIGRAD
jgi:S1-C subfamily serine protease